ncbi:MAG: hypothetical protein CMF23_01635, partial [Ignavibacteriae bacterium]|nr:hypothetical protein [Ignavibacteriota bacterium]
TQLLGIYLRLIMKIYLNYLIFLSTFWGKDHLEFGIWNLEFGISVMDLNNQLISTFNQFIDFFSN